MKISYFIPQYLVLLLKALILRLDKPPVSTNMLGLGRYTGDEAEQELWKGQRSGKTNRQNLATDSQWRPGERETADVMLTWGPGLQEDGRRCSGRDFCTRRRRPQ